MPDPVVVSVPLVGDVEFPASMSMNDITMAVKRLHNDAVLRDPNRKPASTEDFLPKPTGGDGMLDLVKGLMENLIPSGDMVRAGLLHDPVSAAGVGEGVLQGHAQQLQEAVARARDAQNAPNLLQKASNATEAVGHAAAGVLPLIGPAAGQAGERLGNPDTRMRGLGNAMGLLAPEAVTAGTRGVLTGAKGAAAADALDAGATSRLVDVTAPKTGPNKARFGNMADKVAPRLAREDGMGAASRSGLADKVAERLADAQSALDTAADERNGLKTFETAPLVAQLKAARAKLVAGAVDAEHATPAITSPGGSMPAGNVLPRDIQTGQMMKAPAKEGVALGRDVVPTENQPAYGTLTRMINEVAALGPVAQYESLRRLRAAWDEGAKLQYAPSMAADYLKKQAIGRASSNAAGIMRDSLAAAEPETAAANAEFTFWKRADDVLSAAEEADRVRPTRLRRTIADSASGMSKSVLPSLIERIASSGYTTKIASARLLANLADAIRGGRSAEAASILGQVESLVPAGAAARVPSLTAGFAPAVAQENDRR
jgi:hypothetical protein